MQQRSLVFIPAWNEESSVGDVIREIRTELPDVDILVVDDGSTDDTARYAAAAGALVARLPFNQGLGAALRCGYLFALNGDYDLAAHCDADGQHPARELRRLLEAVAGGDCDMALGSRFVDPDATSSQEGETVYHPSLMRRIGIGLFRSLLSAATGQTFTDATSGFRAGNRRVIALFAQRYQSDYAELESLTRLVRAGCVVREIPVVMRPRQAGVSKITPWKSIYWVFNGLVSLSAAALRPRASSPETREEA